MMLRIESQEKKLDELFAKVKLLDEDDENKSHLAKYLCVQVSGYLENVIKNLIEEYHEKSCKPATARYINSRFKTFTNVNDDKLCDLLSTFDPDWLKKYKEKVSDKHITSLSSVISQRHNIAHGNASGSNISFRTIESYYIDIKDIVKELKSIIKK